MDWYTCITEIQAIAQSGLTYTTNNFDKERYQRLLQICVELALEHTSDSRSHLEEVFTCEKGYATPKVDVRAFILQEEKVLLVRERSDGCWSLPGGWADVNYTPAESVVKEVQEETGFIAKAIRLLALWDKRRHHHPAQWPYIYKCFFYCEILSGQPAANLEISEIDFFPLAKLPPLSTQRVTDAQIQKLYAIHTENLLTQFD